MASADPEPVKKPRQSRKREPNEAAAKRLPPMAVRTNTVGPLVTIDHVTRATDKHVASLNRQHRQLLSDIAFLRDEISRRESRADRLQADLDQLRPELARAKADRGYALIGSAFVGLGGIAVSAAGYTSDVLRRPILFAGIATFACGLLIQVAAAHRRPP